MASKALRLNDSGAAVRELQEALNRRAGPRFYPPVVVDEQFGNHTRWAFEALGFALGFTEATLNAPEISVTAQRIIIDPDARDDGQLTRARNRARQLQQRTVAFDGTPVFWGLAKPLLSARERGWGGRLNSADRRKGVAERYGKRSQSSLFDCAQRKLTLGRCPADCAGNCNPANPPGASSHELFSDGSAFGRRAKGSGLQWWELGLDVDDSQGLLDRLLAMGYDVRRTYPDSKQEFHHLNFNANPGRVLPEAGPNARPARKPKLQKVAKTGPLSGVDVSNHQPDIDWAKVKAAGHAFALSKVSEGLGTPDRVFGKGRWKAMRDAGLVRGVYHFARPQKGRDPRDEVREFLGLIDKAGGLKDGDLRPVLDIEAFGAAGRLTAAQTLEWARGFVDEVQARLGRRPIIYTGVFWRETMKNPGDNLDCPLWLAAFVSQAKVKQFIPIAWKDQGLTIWQRTETGSSPGIPGHVDLNLIPGGAKALDRLRL
jgi:lysozyme